MSETAKNGFFALVSVTGIILIWAYAASLTNSSILPGPAEVAGSLRIGLIGGQLLPHIQYTAWAAFLGLLCGAGLGVALAGLVVVIPLLERFIVPVAIGMQSVPKVAIAPLLVTYLGFGLGSKVFTAALLAFFPVFISCVAGLKAIDRENLRLFRAMQATQFQILVHLRLPTAVSYLFAALRISVVLALIGCVVSEFIASKQGIGYVIRARSQELDVSMMFAAIICLTAMGIIGNLTVRAIEKKIVFWKTT